MTAIPFTLEQVTEIFNAGCRRGENEAIAFEWGSICSGQREDDLSDAICDALNEGVGWDDPGFIKGGSLKDVWNAAQAKRGAA